MGRLAEIEEGYIPDSHGIAVVAEENGIIVGRSMLVDAVHIEGTWVHPDYRGGTVGARIIAKLKQEAQKAGISRVIAYSTAATDDYMARLGFKREPVTVWTKDI